MGTILGTGIDIIEIKRIQKALMRFKDAFLNKIYHLSEQQYCLQYKNPAPYFAARFAAKEAVAKALGTGIGKKLKWTDIEISHEASGRPLVILSTRAEEIFDHPLLHISLSHCRTYATAIAIWEERL